MQVSKTLDKKSDWKDIYIISDMLSRIPKRIYLISIHRVPCFFLREELINILSIRNPYSTCNSKARNNMNDQAFTNIELLYIKHYKYYFSAILVLRY